MRKYEEGRTTAQWFCLIVGATLVIVGILGFFVEAKFDTSVGGDPGQVDGENLIVFEVNGWHNVVHVASGLLLLVGAARHALARTMALVFGAIYAVLAIWGLVDGQDILDAVPVNPADNVLHIVLAVLALAVGLISTRPERGREDAGERPVGQASGARRV